MIKKQKLMRLLDIFYIDDLKQEVYEVETLQAKKLLVSRRFDIGFKLFYLEMKSKNVKLAKEIYKEHIRAFSLGKFEEPGNKSKNSIEKYYSEFDEIFEDIKTNDFDASKSLIPLYNGSIANGAHRVASAIYLDKDVKCINIGVKDSIYDYKFFYNLDVSSQILESITNTFIEYADNVYVAFIWPTAKGHKEEIEKIIPNIVYRKELQLNPNGAHNLLSQIYYGEEWLGSVENNFSGVRGKLVECFKSFDPVQIIAFQTDKLDETLEIKKKIRTLFNIGKNSIHITDTKEEALRVSRLVFNDNSIHFLNYAKPNRYLKTHKKLTQFQNYLQKNDVMVDDTVLDSGIVLAVYGLRNVNDIDCFIDDNEKLQYYDDDIETHDDTLKYHDNEKAELIYNPKNYFYFNDLKFVSFNQLYKMKKNRDEQKDNNDCKMMEALIKNDLFKKLVNRFKQKLYYWQIKLYYWWITRLWIFFELLKKFGLYNFVRTIYRFFLKERR